MKQLALMLAVFAFGSLSSCNEGDIRERTYAEVSCFGFLEEDGDQYKCARDYGDKQIGRDELTKATTHTVKVNRRSGTVAFDGGVAGECRVVDFDSWECVERLPRGRLLLFDVMRYRYSRSAGGYVEDWCNANPNGQTAHTFENCQQRYFGLPVSETTRLRAYFWDQYCSQTATKPVGLCAWL